MSRNAFVSCSLFVLLVSFSTSVAAEDVVINGELSVSAEGLRFHDGTYQTTAIAEGPQGPQGPQGSQGPTGNTGPIGLQGLLQGLPDRVDTHFHGRA
jgi:hypothetical protein